MARKVINTTHTVSDYDLLSKTTKNYDKSNYFLKELQDKINAEWKYRPNRVDIAYEDDWGEQTYTPIEVVMQTVKTEKGTAISDDCKNIVFKDISESRFKIGSRFSFNKFLKLRDTDSIYDFCLTSEARELLLTGNDEIITGSDMNKSGSSTGSENSDVILATEAKEKLMSEINELLLLSSSSTKNAIKSRKDNVWIATNTNSAKFTASMVIERCTGTLGSLYKDEQGISYRHYEPVIQTKDLSSTGLSFNKTAVSMDSQLVIIAQHNRYTRQYFVNQRFIIGYDTVYRVKAINKFYSDTTFDPEDAGLVYLYLEITESSPNDDFKHRIAYQSTDVVLPVTTIDGEEQEELEYNIDFIFPEKIPTRIGTKPVIFKLRLINANGYTVQDIHIDCQCTLDGVSDVSEYVSITEVEENKYEIYKKKSYLDSELNIEWYVSEDESPNGKKIALSHKVDIGL